MKENGEESLLESRAIAYCRHRLSFGLTLSNLVLKNIDLDGGKIGTLVDDEGVVPVIDMFETGSKGDPTWGDAEELAVVVNAHLEQNERNLVIAEDALFKPSDPCVTRRTGDMRHFGEELYFFITQGDKYTDAVELAIEQASSWLETIVFTSLPDQCSAAPGPKLTREFLDAIALRTTKLAIGAYDGVSYLIWEKTDQ